MHVEDKQDAQGNENISDDINDTLSVEEEFFLKHYKSFRMLILILIQVIVQWKSGPVIILMNKFLVILIIVC